MTANVTIVFRKPTIIYMYMVGGGVVLAIICDRVPLEPSYNILEI